MTPAVRVATRYPSYNRFVGLKRVSLTNYDSFAHAHRYAWTSTNGYDWPRTVGQEESSAKE